MKQKNTGCLHLALTIVGGILCVIFGFAFLCNMVIIVKGMLYPEKPPSVFGTTPMAVLSGSMSGTAPDHIEVGDLIFVDKIQPEQLQVGDVIAFMEGRIVVTHRIVDIETSAAGQRLFYTKGDANNAVDDHPVTEENLIGIYKARIPKIGDFAMFLRTPLGMVLFIGIPVVVLVGIDLLRSRRTRKAEAEKTKALEAEVQRLKQMTQDQNGGAAVR